MVAQRPIRKTLSHGIRFEYYINGNNPLTTDSDRFNLFFTIYFVGLFTISRMACSPGNRV